MMSLWDVLKEIWKSPALYPHLINSFLKLANSRLAVVIEGSECVASWAEGVALMLRVLLGEPCPILSEKLEPPCLSLRESILNCICSHRPYWRCLQLRDTYAIDELNTTKPQMNLHKIKRLCIKKPPLEQFSTQVLVPHDLIEKDCLKLNCYRIAYVFVMFMTS
uniref:Uncharacterized protein n=1 Tax=Glossina pallidipes TaxID=7398 RepID=A0A1A9ZCP5_GLOPL